MTGVDMEESSEYSSPEGNDSNKGLDRMYDMMIKATAAAVKPVQDKMAEIQSTSRADADDIRASIADLAGRDERREEQVKKICESQRSLEKRMSDMEERVRREKGEVKDMIKESFMRRKTWDASCKLGTSILKMEMRYIHPTICTKPECNGCSDVNLRGLDPVRATTKATQDKDTEDLLRLIAVLAPKTTANLAKKGLTWDKIIQWSQRRGNPQFDLNKNLRAMDFVIRGEHHEAAASMIAEAGPQSDARLLEGMQFRSWVSAGKGGPMPSRAPVIDYVADDATKTRRWELEVAVRMINSYVNEKVSNHGLDFRVLGGREGRDPHIRVLGGDHRSNRQWDGELAEKLLVEAVKVVEEKSGKVERLGGNAMSDIGRHLPKTGDASQVTTEGKEAIERLLAAALPQEG